MFSHQWVCLPAVAPSAVVGLWGVYMLSLWCVFFCAFTSSGFCQTAAATRFPSCDAKETSGFFQCGQHTGEASALHVCWGFYFRLESKLHQIGFTQCNLISAFCSFTIQWSIQCNRAQANVNWIGLKSDCFVYRGFIFFHCCTMRDSDHFKWIKCK